MTLRTAVGAAAVLVVASGCMGLGEERICSQGEHPVRPADGGIGGACAEDGQDPPRGFMAYPDAQVPQTAGDKWDVYWADQQQTRSREIETKRALAGLRPLGDPVSWRRVDLDGVGSIAAPAGWAVTTTGAVTRLGPGPDGVEVAIERGAAGALDQRADAIRTEQTDLTDPVADLDTAAAWPGATTARYLRTERWLPDEDGYVSHETLLLTTADGSLVVVRGTLADAELTPGSVPGHVLRTLVLGATP